MLTWIGFLGKILEFLAKKLGDKAFEHLGAKKPLAAECLMRIYMAIAELEGLTTKLLLAAQDSLDDNSSVMLIQEVSISERAVQAESQTLIDSLVALGPVLSIFDPTLHRSLDIVCEGKSNILYEASRSLVIEKEEGSYRLVRLRFKSPSDKLLELDIESHYRWLQENPHRANWKNLEWPQRLLIKSQLDDAFADSEIDFNVSSNEIISDLKKKLEQHLKLLSAARESLKHLIKQKLSLDDVLYVSSKIEASRQYMRH